MTKTWDQLIAEGESLKIMEERIDAEAGNVRWLWGDLALEVAPMGARSGPANGVNDRLQQFADELDVSFQSLRQYRSVAEAWPLGMRVPNQPWVVHQQIMGHNDREELIASPVDVRTGERTERWTYRNMQRFLGKKPSPHYQAPPTTTEEKVEVAMALIEDPEVRVEVRRNLNMEASLLRPEPQHPRRDENPDNWTAAQWAEFDLRVVAATRVILTAFNLQQRSGYQPSVEATALLAIIKPQDLDAELRALLEAHN